MSSFVPQIVKIWRERDASSVSLRMYVVTVTGFVLWTTYGALTGSWPVIVSNAICLMLSAAILALLLRNKVAWRLATDVPSTEVERSSERSPVAGFHTGDRRVPTPAVLPEITFRAAGDVPPTTPPPPNTPTPSPLGCATLPVASMPMKLPSR